MEIYEGCRLQDFAFSFRWLLGRLGAKSSTLENLRKKLARNTHVSFMGKTAPAFCLGDFVSLPCSRFLYIVLAFFIQSSAMLIYSANSPRGAHFSLRAIWSLLRLLNIHRLKLGFDPGSPAEACRSTLADMAVARNGLACDLKS